MTDYFGWQSAKQRRARLDDDPTEHQVGASEPIEVVEHDPDHANTTVIERIREAIRDRIRKG